MGIGTSQSRLKIWIQLQRRLQSRLEFFFIRRLKRLEFLNSRIGSGYESKKKGVGKGYASTSRSPLHEAGTSRHIRVRRSGLVYLVAAGRSAAGGIEGRAAIADRV